MRTPRTLAAVAALAVGLAACDAMPAGPDFDDDDQLGAIFATTGDAGVSGADGNRRDTRGGSVFDRLNAQIDGFAGIYRVAACSVVLVLTDVADVDEAIRIVHAVIDPLVERSCPSGVAVRPQPGTWTYDELHRFLAVALPLVGTRGVFAASVSYPLNAVQVTVADRATARRVLVHLAAQGVPAGAIAFRIRGSALAHR